MALLDDIPREEAERCNTQGQNVSDQGGIPDTTTVEPFDTFTPLSSVFFPLDREAFRFGASPPNSPNKPNAMNLRYEQEHTMAQQETFISMKGALENVDPAAASQAVRSEPTLLVRVALCVNGFPRLLDGPVLKLTYNATTSPNGTVTSSTGGPLTVQEGESICLYADTQLGTVLIPPATSSGPLQSWGDEQFFYNEANIPMTILAGHGTSTTPSIVYGVRGTAPVGVFF